MARNSDPPPHKRTNLYTPEDDSTPTRRNIKVYKSSANLLNAPIVAASGASSDGHSDCNVSSRLSKMTHTPNKAKTKIRALDAPSKRKCE
ncbi:hypothetical protein FRC12_009126 [Ceratobasidium sp. 428]|nr:hypothetical protein FRC12_009126 [Ceratobasidium sp. 428]